METRSIFPEQTQTSDPLVGTYLREGEVLRCDFGDRVSIVNPTDRSVYVDLHGLHRSSTGEIVGQVMLSPHSHMDLFKI
jgi:hypothetical protein